MAHNPQSTHAGIAAVIFDYGNVLTRTLDPTPRAVWEQRLGLTPGALEGLVHNDRSWIAAQRGEITPQQHWYEVGRSLGLTLKETAALRTAFYRGDRLNTALVNYIDQLRSAGLRVALLSNFSTELHTFLQRYDLRQRFDCTAISADIGVMKPAAAAYEAVLRMLALQACACVFVDDMPANVDAAVALGLHGIVFRNNASCLQALDRLLASRIC